MKKYLALLLTMVLLLVPVLTGCSKKEQSQVNNAENKTTTGQNTTANNDGNKTDSADNGNSSGVIETTGQLSDKTVTIALSTEPNTLIPSINFTSNDVSAVTNLMYETLFYSDYDTLVPTEDSIVEKYEFIDDTHFRLTLRKGIKFHNGDELTTADVLYTFQEATKGGMAGEYKIYDVPNFVIEDDYNIVFALTQPWAQGMERLAFEQFYIINKKALEAAGGASTSQQYLENAGTGKYIFKEWVPGEYILLERNENYWNEAKKPYFKNVKFVFINDATARGLAVQSGDVDIATSLDLANFSVYDADPNVETVLLYKNLTQTIFLNSGKGGPLADKRVREAVYWSLDKEALRQVGASGFGEIQDTVISTLSPMWDGVKPEVYKPDNEKAKQLLAEAGYPDGVTLRFRTSSENALTSMIVEQLRQSNINAELVVAEFPVHFAALGEGDFDMYLSAQQFAYYTEPVRCTDGLTYDYSDVMGGCGYKNEEYSEICARCYKAIDIEERKAAYAELQKHFRENYVSIGLFSSTDLALSRKGINNIQLRGMGVIDFGYIYEN